MNIVLKEIWNKYIKWPNEQAIVDKFGSHSFDEVVKTSYAIFKKIQLHKVREYDYITIELESTHLYFCSIFACQMIGAVFIPLSNTYPVQRCKEIKDMCNVALTIDNDFIEEFLRDTTESTKTNWVNEDINEDEFSNKVVDAPEMIIFTSGSTGKPKGVVHSTRSLHEAITRMQNRKDWLLNEDIRYANVSPLTFVLGIQTCLVSLIQQSQHGVLFLPPAEIIANPKAFVKYINENKIKNLGLSVKYAKLLPLEKTYVKAIYVGSEIISNFYYKNINCISSYGSSELGGSATSFFIDKFYGNTPIGEAMGNLKAYVLNDKNEEAEQGELCFAGVLPLGYINEPAVTNKTFIKNPFKDIDGFDRMLKTGDRAIRSTNGIVCIGRKDSMVKINGNRVELNELNFQLRNIPQIDEVFSKKFVHNNLDFIVSYVKVNTEISDEEIKQELAKSLPNYMIPHCIIRLENFPLSKNLKINTKALPTPNFEHANTECSQKNKSLTDKISDGFLNELIAAYKHVFAITNIDADSDFVKLGGDSLSAMKIINCINFDIETNYIYKHRTPKKIAEALAQYNEFKDENNATYVDSKKCDIKNNNNSLYQFNNALNLMARAYNNKEPYNSNVVIYTFAFAAQINNTNEKELSDFVKQLLDTFPILKTKITKLDNVYYLQRRDDWYPQITVITIDTKPDTEFFKKATSEFGLEDCDLIRFTIFKYKNYMYLHGSVSHFLVDGNSLNYMAQFFVQWLIGKLNITEKINIFDYWDKLNKIHAANNTKDELYYSNLLEGYSFTLLPEFKHEQTVNKINLPDPTYNRIFKNYKISSIESSCKNNRISTSTFFLACFVKALYTATKKNDICILAYNNGRNNFIGDQTTVGCLFDFYPVVYSFKDKDLSIIDIAKDLSEQIATSRQHHFDFIKFKNKVPLDCIIYNYAVFDSVNDILNLSNISKTDLVQMRLQQKFKPHFISLDWYATIAVSPKIEKTDNEYRAGISYNLRNYAEEDIKKLSVLFWKNIESNL